MTSLAFSNSAVSPSQLKSDRAVADEPSRRAVIGGRIVSGLGVAFLTFDACFKLAMAGEAAKASSDLGFQGDTIFGIGVLQVLLLIIYLIPRTAVLGAVLWTGYFGGAIATHVRVGNPLFSHVLFPIYIAALLWVGLWLRDKRLRALTRA